MGNFVFQVAALHVSLAGSSCASARAGFTESRGVAPGAEGSFSLT